MGVGASDGTARIERRRGCYPLFLAEILEAQGVLREHEILMFEGREESEAKEEKRREGERETGREGERKRRKERDTAR